MPDRKINPPVLKSEEVAVTPPGRLLWPRFDKPDDLDDMYKTVLVVDPEHKDFPAFSKVVKDFAKAAFPKGFPGRLTWCIRKGEDFANPDKKMGDAARELCRTGTVITSKSKFSPNVYVRANKKFVPATDVRRDFYSGAVASVAGTLEAYDGQYPAIVFRLNEVVKLADGERVGGRDPNKVFAGLQDEADEAIGSGATGSALDDEIPF